MYILNIHGKQASVGSKIKLLKIDEEIFDGLPDDEIDSINSMLNEEFEIENVDLDGYPWIEKWWQKEDCSSYSHSIRLNSRSFEILVT